MQDGSLQVCLVMVQGCQRSSQRVSTLALESAFPECYPQDVGWEEVGGSGNSTVQRGCPA